MLRERRLLVAPAVSAFTSVLRSQVAAVTALHVGRRLPRISPRGQLHERRVAVKARRHPVALLPLQARSMLRACHSRLAAYGASEVGLEQQLHRRRVATVAQLPQPVLEIEEGVSAESGQGVVVVSHHRHICFAGGVVGAAILVAMICRINLGSCSDPPEEKMDCRNL
jgi:hypothetical protein